MSETPRDPNVRLTSEQRRLFNMYRSAGFEASDAFEQATQPLNPLAHYPTGLERVALNYRGSMVFGRLAHPLEQHSE